MPKDALTRRRGRRAAGFCQEQTLLMTEQFSRMERNAFHGSYLSDKIPKAVFLGQVVKTVAYLRVSTAQQDLRSQRLAILEYARKHDFRIDDFIEATASGQASEKRRRLDELMNVLQRGDRLVVSELSRLGRPLGQIVAILDALAQARSSGARKARWASHGSMARRMISGASSSWAFPRLRSPSSRACPLRPSTAS